MSRWTEIEGGIETALEDEGPYPVIVNRPNRHRRDSLSIHRRAGHIPDCLAALAVIDSQGIAGKAKNVRVAVNGDAVAF